MKTAREILQEAGLPPPPKGEDRYYAVCPRCSTQRSPAHQKTKCLGIKITAEGVKWGCNHCQWTGGRYFNGKDDDPIIASYAYEDENGTVLFRKVRTAAKKFWQQHPDGHGGWTNGLKNIRRVLYRLPELIEAIATDHTVLIVEGEKDVDRLRQLGIPATCNPEGASESGKKWRQDYTEALRGADVVLLPDNDEPGWKHVHNVSAALAGIAARTRVLVLPNLPPSGDVSDWLDAGGTREQLDVLVEQAQDWQPPSADKTSEPNADEKAKAKAREDELLEALAKAEGLDYARKRKAAAEELDVSARDVDAAVKIRREDSQVAPLYGHWITEPWPEPVEGDSLLRDIIRRIQRHVVVSDDNALAIALWVMMAWVHDEIAVHSPILNINSVEPESGKTTTIGVISFLMPKCIATVSISEAAIFRSIHRWQPSFAIDEFDDVLASADKNKNALKEVINSGHTRGITVVRCLEPDYIPHNFSTFAPKAIGMVGRKLPPATLSRCIFVELRRRKKDERFEKFKHVDDDELAALRRRLFRWSIDNEDTLRNAEPSVPELLNRRSDNWWVQFAIADLAGADWGDKTRAAAAKIETGSDSRTASVRALAALKTVFDDTEDDVIGSEDVIQKITADQDLDWVEWKNGKPITQKQLANLLKRYGITPERVWIGGRRIRGYLRAHFIEAWERYL